jgi:hypothetical protein
MDRNAFHFNALWRFSEKAGGSRCVGDSSALLMGTGSGENCFSSHS